MLRRTAIAALVGGSRMAAHRMAPLGRYVGDANGTALLLDFRRRRLIAAARTDLACEWLAPPGSTLKPFSLSALMATGKLARDEQFLCPGKLEIAGRSFACSHPPMGVGMRVATAIAYSCNCFVAHYAQRFEAGELARHLERSGFTSRTGLVSDDEVAGEVQPAESMDARRLQALGEQSTLVTALEMVVAYHRLASSGADAAMAPIMEGLEGAVEYGTAQLAGVPGIKVAGKTGTVRTRGGLRAAWFAGFAPARAPEVVVTVLVHGRSGGADAAPIAGRILEAHRAGQL